jgi:hypothetical protein
VFFGSPLEMSDVYSNRQRKTMDLSNLTRNIRKYNERGIGGSFVPFLISDFFIKIH